MGKNAFGNGNDRYAFAGTPVVYYPCIVEILPVSIFNLGKYIRDTYLSL